MLTLGEPFSFDQLLPAGVSTGQIEHEAQTRVAIIGAGLAGLSCAFRLTAGGQRNLEPGKLVLLEREARPGGRIRSLKIDDTIINLGAVTFQPEHYQRYTALLADLGLTGHIRIIPRRRMLFGYQHKNVRADNLSLMWDTVKGLIGQGVYSTLEVAQLLRFYFFMRRVTAPENEAEFMALHQMSVAEWARSFGFSQSLQHKFVQPLIHYCFRAPEEVSAAFGIFLLGFNLSRPATLVGGFGQVAEAMAARLKQVIKAKATVLNITRKSDGFTVVYSQEDQLHRLQAQNLVVAVPANVAAKLLPEMQPRAGQVEYGQGTGMLVAGLPKQNVDLQLHVSVGPAGTIIYGGEVQAAGNGKHYANVLTYRGENSIATIAQLFQDGRVDKLIEYTIQPASAAPKPGQAPLPLDWGDGLYMAGDSVGLFPSQETAVSTGESVANLLQKAIEND